MASAVLIRENELCETVGAKSCRPKMSLSCGRKGNGMANLDSMIHATYGDKRQVRMAFNNVHNGAVPLQNVM
jgi:hypothetical protein